MSRIHEINEGGSYLIDLEHVIAVLPVTRDIHNAFFAIMVTHGEIMIQARYSDKDIEACHPTTTQEEFDLICRRYESKANVIRDGLVESWRAYKLGTAFYSGKDAD